MCNRLRQALPFASAPGFGAQRLHGVQAVHGFEQVGGALGAFLHRLVDLARQRFAGDQRYTEKQRNGHQRNQGKPSADQGDDRKKKHHEWQVAQHGEGAGGKKLAYRLEVAHGVCQYTTGSGPVGCPHAQTLGKHLSRQGHVHAPSGRLQQVAAQQTHGHLEPDHQHSRSTEHRKTAHRVVRNDPVVHRHAVERHQRAEHIQYQRTQQRPAKHPAVAVEGVPEPAAGLRQRVEQTALVKMQCRAYRPPRRLRNFGRQSCAVQQGDTVDTWQMAFEAAVTQGQHHCRFAVGPDQQCGHFGRPSGLPGCQQGAQ